MESSKPNLTTQVKYFPLQDDLVYAQFQINMSIKDFNKLYNSGKQVQEKRAVLLCLDKSGSMAGTPFNGLIQGAIDVAEQIYQKGEENLFYTLFYDQECYVVQRPTYEVYRDFLKKQQAGGSTNFVKVFEKIQDVAIQNELQCISVIFFTDGQDNQNSKPVINAELQKLKQKLSGLKSKFLTIGFTNDHDAKFLNDITEAGSELGNFFFVDTSNPKYQQQITDCLVSSLDQAFSKNSLNISVVNLMDPQSGEINLTLGTSSFDTLTEEEKNDENTILKFKVDTLVKKDQIQEFGIMLKVTDQETIETEKTVEQMKATPENVISSKIYFINQQIFDIVKMLQNTKQTSTKDDSYEIIKKLNIELDLCAREVFKIGDKTARTNLLTTMSTCRQNVDKILQILRSQVGEFSNAQIAQLNDLAYKAIRSKRIKGKLDKRAIENQSVYKKLEDEIKDYVKQLDLEKLRESNKDTIADIGDCFLSCNDTIDAIKAEDCMCIALDIARPEDAIVEPSKLIIKDIIPTFVSSEAFLGSALFNLNINDEAHGGFDVHGKGKLAMGLGRENITGVFPLFLFEEHWEVARRKIAPVFGYMCTLDIMGYNDDQLKVIPFMVLLQALQKLNEQPDKEVIKKMHYYILKTAQIILMKNDELRNESVQQISEFTEKPAARTKEIVPSINTLIAKTYCLSTIEDYEKFMPNGTKLTGKQLYNIYRYGFEEILRRMIKEEKIQFSVEEVLSILFPQYEEFAKALIEKANKILEEEKAGKQEEEIKSYQQMQEVKKIEQQKIDKIDEEEIKVEIAKIIESNQWIHQLDDQYSKMNRAINKFVEKFEWPNQQLIVTGPSIIGNQEMFEDIKKVTVRPQSQNDKFIYFSILMQNQIQQDNAKRRLAIQKGQYVQIQNHQDCINVLQKVTKKYLKLKISEIRASFKQRVQSSMAGGDALEAFFNATNMQTTIAMFQEMQYMQRKKKKITRQLKYVTRNQKEFPLMKEKLDLLNRLFKFSFIRIVYKIWMNYCKSENLISIEDLIELYPDYESKLRYHENCTDSYGNTLPKSQWKDPNYKKI